MIGKLIFWRAFCVFAVLVALPVLAIRVAIEGAWTEARLQLPMEWDAIRKYWRGEPWRIP